LSDRNSENKLMFTLFAGKMRTIAARKQIKYWDTQRAPWQNHWEPYQDWVCC